MALSAAVLSCLTACGGGGGGSSPKEDPANAADGLGTPGHVAGTVTLGDANTPGGLQGSGNYLGVATALSDAGRGLVVWRKPVADRDIRASWSQSSSDGTWSAAAALPQAANSNYAGFTLRMNAHGNAVLGWDNQPYSTAPLQPNGRRAARFIQGQGWDADTYDVSGGSSAVNFGEGVFLSPRSWDLAMLQDDSFTSTVMLNGTTNRYVAALRTAANGTQATSLATGEQAQLLYSPYAHFAPRTDGFGLMYHVADGSPSGITLNAQLASIYSGAFAPFPIGNFTTGLCYLENYSDPLVAATSQTLEGAVAVVSSDAISGCGWHELRLVKVLTSPGISVLSTRVNEPNTTIPTSPAIVIDQNGHALAVWKESSGQSFSTTPRTTRLMWSQSQAGQAWSTPQQLDLSAIGIVPVNGHIALAMNASGQAVLALTLHGFERGSVNPVIAASKFSASGGWQGWRAMANKQSMSDPAVAINSSGQSLLAYTAIDAKRVGGKAPTAFDGSQVMRVFALRF